MDPRPRKAFLAQVEAETARRLKPASGPLKNQGDKLDPHAAVLPDAATRSNPQLLRQLYGAAVEGDSDGFQALLTDDVSIEIAGYAPFACSCRGKAAVAEAVRANLAKVREQAPRLTAMLADDTHVAVMLEETGELVDGRRYHVRGMQWFTFRDGKVARIDQLCLEV